MLGVRRPILVVEDDPETAGQLVDSLTTSPVLIVSALGEIDDRVRGLRAGGDDYLVALGLPRSWVAAGMTVP
jgi:hypothetical protein